MVDAIERAHDVVVRRRWPLVFLALAVIYPLVAWRLSTGAQLKAEVARIGGILLIMGILHAANVLALPIIGLGQALVEIDQRPFGNVDLERLGSVMARLAHEVVLVEQRTLEQVQEMVRRMLDAALPTQDRVVSLSYAWLAATHKGDAGPGRALQWWLTQLESPTTRAALLTRRAVTAQSARRARSPGSVAAERSWLRCGRSWRAR